MSNVNIGLVPREGSAGSALDTRLPVEEILLTDDIEAPVGGTGTEIVGGRDTMLKKQNQKGRSAVEIEEANRIFTFIDDGTFLRDALLTNVPGFPDGDGLVEEDVHQLNTTAASAKAHGGPDSGAELVADSNLAKKIAEKPGSKLEAARTLVKVCF
jgi:hypothetical protein